MWDHPGSPSRYRLQRVQESHVDGVKSGHDQDRVAPGTLALSVRSVDQSIKRSIANLGRGRRHWRNTSGAPSTGRDDQPRGRAVGHIRAPATSMHRRHRRSPVRLHNTNHRTYKWITNEDGSLRLFRDGPGCVKGALPHVLDTEPYVDEALLLPRRLPGRRPEFGLDPHGQAQAMTCPAGYFAIEDMTSLRHRAVGVRSLGRRGVALDLRVPAEVTVRMTSSARCHVDGFTGGTSPSRTGCKRALWWAADGASETGARVG